MKATIPIQYPAYSKRNVLGNYPLYLIVAAYMGLALKIKFYRCVIISEERYY